MDRELVFDPSIPGSMPAAAKAQMKDFSAFRALGDKKELVMMI